MTTRFRSKSTFQPARLFSRKRNDSTKKYRNVRLYFLTVLFIILICAFISLRDGVSKLARSTLTDQFSNSSLASSFTNTSLQSSQHLVPRHTHVSLIADRKPQLSQSDNAPTLHAIFACRCYVDHVAQPLQSLLQQTFIPRKLTLIHGCLSNQRDELQHAVYRVLSVTKTEDDSVSMYPEVNDHQCNESDIQLCLLRYLTAIAETDPSNFYVLLTDRVILEPTALEKACLSLTIRPHVASIQILEYILDSYRKQGKKMILCWFGVNCLIQRNKMILLFLFPLFTMLHIFEML